MTKSEKKVSKKEQLHVIGVGASAGGLDALSKFLANFNGADVNFCVVIVMHLSPDYKSELSSILAKRCKWPVHTVVNNIEIKKKVVYVTPQNCDLHVKGNKLRLDELPPKYSHAPSIDNFFTSLAKSHGNNAIGVILSGFGKDGTDGIRKIKHNNGFTMAQLPETAEHRDMPKSAIDSQDIDLIIPVEQMFDEICQYITNSHTIAQSQPSKKSVDAIFQLLEKRSGTDFSLYKPTTIMRRINHRMANLQIETLLEYYSMIKNSPKELDVLFETVLIGVTEFFRDKEAFESLKNHLERIIKEKKFGDSIRIWSVGCASGEEPFSIGILLHELLGDSINQYYLQIFASDIDERALNFCRKGLYPKESLKNLAPKLVEKYFRKKDNNHYEIKKTIKQHILFTRHDISNDPPFVKLDVVVCRNLLIYFNNNLQKQSLQIFHYALRPKGILFLGKSESISSVSDLFTKSDGSKIFHKADASLNYDIRFSRFRSHKALLDKAEQRSKSRNMSIVDIAKETLYYKYQHPFVIVNEHAEIKEVHGSLRLYLEISQGAMNANLYKMANPELVTVLKAVQAQVKKTGVQHLSHIVKFKLYDSDHYVRIRNTPLIYEIKDVPYFLVAFEKIEPSEQMLEIEKKLETSDFVDLRIKELEDELATNREHLQIFTEELEATNEELQTINEELQSANEELKSSNEELETSNEELQSANEELNTANHELRITNEALIDKEKELQEEKELSQNNEVIYRTISENIPDGAVGILNEDLEIEYLAGQGMDDLNPDDFIGLYMPSLNPLKREAKRLEALCKETLEGTPGNLEVNYKGRFYIIKTVPFNLPNDKSKKILYLTQEITSEKRNQIKLETALNAANLLVFSYDFKTDTVEPNRPFSKFFEYPPSKKIREKDIVARIHPDDRNIRAKSIKESQKTGNVLYEVRLKLPSGTKYIRVRGRMFTTKRGKPISKLATLMDITKDMELLEKVKRSEERFKEIADVAPLTIWVADENMLSTYVNKTWLDFTGSTLKDNIGRGFLEFVHPDDKEDVVKLFSDAFNDKKPITHEYRARRHDGEYRWFVNHGAPIIDNSGEFKGYIGSNTDITEKKMFTEKLEQTIQKRTKELKKSNEELIRVNINLEEYAYVASHDLQEPLRKIRTFNSMLKDLQEEEGSIDKYSDKIEQLAKRMTELIKGILEYGELSNEGGKLEQIDLDDLVEKIKMDIEESLKDKNAKLDAKELGFLKGYPVYIYQLFMNLIENGIKFNKQKIPTIKIKTTEVEGGKLTSIFSADKNINYKKLEFKDNGIGIKEEYQDVIFKPFKRLYSKNEYKGTGIGLAICKRIVDLHRGHIVVEGNSAKGTTFVVYLPA